MQRIALLSLAAFAGALAAQSNTVAGLDGRLSVVDSLTYWGRRGAAFPGGEVGMSMLNTMCNPGTVQIPWQAAMQANHPKFGFLIMRLSGDRMVQINDYSYCKHAFTSTNGSGACGTCIGTGGLGGTVMGVHCSDTYGAGNNGDRTWLGPATELDPWLGTWNPVGSYFDVGDPATGTGAADGARSLNVTGFDVVKNRVTVKETDLNVAGASYFYGIHLMHQGEAAANRGDNLASRGFTPSWNGTTWSFNNNAVGQIYGSILQHWTGAQVNSARNGNDDGTFHVACKVTPLGGGIYHYEYAVHNQDNNRGGAALHIPVDLAAIVTNIGFRDIDSNSLNDWTSARVGNDLVFSAAANNALNWNSIYNFWFDCNLAPSNAAVRMDEARVGAGLLDVTIVSQAPSGGLPLASVSTIGTSCGQINCNSSIYESFPAATCDLSGLGMTMTLSGSNYVVGTGTGTFVAPTGATLALTDDSEATVTLPFTLPFPGGSTTQLVVCSNGFVSPVSNGTSFTPDVPSFLAGAPCWAAAWHDFNPAAANSGTVRVDSSASVVRITFNGVFSFGTTSPATFQYQFFPNGTVNIIWQTMTPAGNNYIVGWTPGAGASDPGSRDLSATLGTPTTLCSGPFTGSALSASARPVFGTTIALNTTNIPAGSPFAALVLSFTQANPPQDLSSLGMPGCFGHVVGGSSYLYVTPAGSGSTNLFIPSNPSYTGTPVVGQSFVMNSAFNSLGVIATNGVLMVLGPQ